MTSLRDVIAHATGCRWRSTPTARTGRFTRRRRRGRSTSHQLTQVGRALARLGIEHIPSYSPQARGRSERLNRTFQDRLVNELRVAGITTLAAANVLSRATASCPQLQRHVQLRAGAIRRVPSSPLGPVDLDADSLSRRGARRRPRQHGAVRRPRVADRAAARPPLLCRPAASPSASISTARTRSGARRAALGHIRPCSSGRAIGGRPWAYGSCRCRGRQERAHRALENAQNAFPTAAHRPHSMTKRSDHLSNGSGQITCQQQAPIRPSNRRLGAPFGPLILQGISSRMPAICRRLCRNRFPRWHRDQRSAHSRRRGSHQSTPFAAS